MPGTAALLLSSMAIATTTGQFMVGIFLDRVQSPRIALPVFGCIFLGLTLLHFAPNPAVLFAGAIQLGFGAGSEYGLLPYFIARFFGLRSFGRIYGLLYASAAAAVGIGSFIMGATFDHQGSYNPAFYAFEAGALLTLILLVRLSGYVYAANGMPLARELQAEVPL